MYFISGGIGFLACIIFIVLIILGSLRGKPCRTPLIALFLSVLLFLGSGFLYSRTDPEVGGTAFLKYVLRDQSVPPDLIGEWKERTKSEDSYHGIIISGDTIEIYWVSDGGESAALYWAGSFEAPQDGKEPYTWESVNDVGRTSAAQLASGEKTKTFTYQNGVLSYSASVLGITTTVEAKKQPWQSVDNSEEEPVNSGVSPVRLTASGDLGNYFVEVKGAALTSDSAGNSVIVVTYSWTNNSENVTNVLTNMLEKAYQNGKPLSTVVLSPEEVAPVYDTAARVQDVEPGETVDVECAFLLNNEKNVVEFGVSELLSASGDIVVMEFTPADLSYREPPATPKE